MTLQYKCPDTKNDKFLIENVFNHKKKGFFIEIGAADGIGDSCTYLLETEYNWKGIAVEPHPDFYAKLVQNRKCKCINQALHRVTGANTYIKSNNPYYSCIKEHALKHHYSQIYDDGYELINVKTTTFREIFKKHKCPKHIDLISIDVEGGEYDCLIDFPFEEYNVSIFVLEKSQPLLVNLMNSYGYTEIKNPHSSVNWELYFVKNDKKNNIS